MMQFKGVKVFSATMARGREEMGGHITRWIERNPEMVVVDREVLQSSDSEFHCLTTIFFTTTSNL